MDEPTADWEVVTTRPLVEGTALLIRSPEGSKWGVQVEWNGGLTEWTRHASKDIAIEEFWKL